ncbi:MAG TPA: Stp1/IreP family PP2C-type Ser/Thr phosphatase [Ktedonobacteraceae bacterium]|nr:Stp1/IreP family PP2C-type Ser/Thr phosphatase [Ktedonobacteraceae bacterium]
MAAVPGARQLVLADRCYRLLLLAYPARFRRAYAHEMAQTFRAACRETLHTEGNWGLARLCGYTLCDLVTTSLKEHGQMLFFRLKRLFGKQSLVFSPDGLDTMLLTTPLRLQVAQHTDIGCKRSRNEDNLIAVLPEDPQTLRNKGALFVVADGMGGHSHGERASELAVSTLRESYYRNKEEDIGLSLVQAIREANALIYAENISRVDASDPTSGMGTTCVAAVLQEKSLVVANVGDSRVYVVHDGQIRQVSQDHSLVADMVRAGLLTPDQANCHEQRNIIYRALGIEPDVEVDVFEEAVEEGDALILCTDGLSGLVAEEEMLQIVETYQPEESVRQLIARANAAGGPDNITAIVVRVDERA